MSSSPRWLLLPLAFVLAAASPGRAPQKWVLLVGINDYIEFGDEAGGDLRGPENDVRAVTDVLVRRFGFPPDHVRQLVSREATREAIRDALVNWLAANARPGDLAVFYFSGHGSLAMDDNGDEEDGLDETLCPADVLRNSTRNDIRDDELEAWLGGIPSEVTVILDSCHSGTATRMLRGVRGKALGRPAPPSRLGTRGLTGVALDSTGMMDGAHILEIAASAPDQTAMDASWGEPGQERYGGAFTTHLVRKLWQAPEGVSWRELFLNTVVSLKADRFAQDPQIAGPVSEALFATRGSNVVVAAAPAAPHPPELSLRLLQVTGTRAVLSGGSDRGLTVGSVLQASGGALLRVTATEAGQAEASVEQGAPSPGDSLELLAYALPRKQLVVDVAQLAPAVLAALRPLLPDSATIRFDSAAAIPDLSLSSSRDSVVLLSRDGQLRALAVPDSAGLRWVAEKLEAEVSLGEVANIENPASGFRVQLEVANGQRTFRVGDQISFRVRSEQPGYITLVDLGTDGRLTVLYPTAGAPARRLGVGEDLVLPSPDMVFTIGDGTPAGTGMVRAIVTSEPLELPVDPDATAFAAALRKVLDPPATRGIVVQRARSAAAWATSLVVYAVEH